jgi:hypothetical protein
MDCGCQSAGRSLFKGATAAAAVSDTGAAAGVKLAMLTLPQLFSYISQPRATFTAAASSTAAGLDDLEGLQLWAHGGPTRQPADTAEGESTTRNTSASLLVC